MCPAVRSTRRAVSTRVLLNAEEMRRALVRMAHEIVEQNGGVEEIVLVGLCTRGAPLAQRIREAIRLSERADVPCGQLDVTSYRDDLVANSTRPAHEAMLRIGVTDTRIVLVDDVLYTGRTIRAALDALMDCGRPRSVKVAVLIDRGHRELPIRANFVGKSIPTSEHELVEVHVAEVDGQDAVVLRELDGERGIHQRRHQRLV